MMEIKNNIGRRSFLKLSATAGLAVMANNAFAASPFLKPYVVDNPLKSYPNRDWEKVYRDMFHVDSEFIFLCAPNDTHNCLLKAHVKNDV
ncbi:MAG: Tat (twin-arginine translocation) pathway signal sequence, partial [Candidatus Nitrotoga sp. MKT]